MWRRWKAQSAALAAWRRVDDVSYALRITDAGLSAIGVGEERAEADTAIDDKSGSKPKSAGRTRDSGDSSRKPKRATPKGVVFAKPARKTVGLKAGPAAERPRRSRSGSKIEQVKGLLSRKRGATIQDMMDATSWLPHTTRAVLSGLRKRGLRIERETSKGKPTIYRIVEPAEVAASERAA